MPKLAAMIRITRTMTIAAKTSHRFLIVSYIRGGKIELPATECYVTAATMLSDVEREELRARPVGSIHQELPPEHLALRRGIARKLFEIVKTTPWWSERPAAVRDAYERYPPWKFYRSDSGAPRRVYGVCEYGDGSCGLHAVTAHFLWVNDIVGGIPLSEASGGLIEADTWSESERTIIDTCGGAISRMAGTPSAGDTAAGMSVGSSSTAPGIFYDPCGWLLLGTSGTSDDS